MDTLDKIEHTGGMKRSSVAPRYDLIHNGFIRRCTNNIEFGEGKYGRDNWRAALNDPKALLDVVNHLQEHVNSIKDQVIAYTQESGSIPKEDDIAHAAFNLMILSVFYDRMGLTAEYWRPAYEKRLEEWRKNNEVNCESTVEEREHTELGFQRHFANLATADQIAKQQAKIEREADARIQSLGLKVPGKPLSNGSKKVRP